MGDEGEGGGTGCEGRVGQGTGGWGGNGVGHRLRITRSAVGVIF